MPAHDWTRATDNDFHNFHTIWLVEICRTLNSGVLPPSYYAMTQQRILGGLEPDVLALEAVSHTSNGPPIPGQTGGPVLTLPAPPRLQAAHRFEPDTRSRRRFLGVRDAAGDRLVAVIEIISRGNKSSVHAVSAFVGKALELLDVGIHLLILDLFPPTPRDPAGLHNRIWRELAEDNPTLPADKPLTFASFDAGAGIAFTAYSVPTAVGESLPTMPLFLQPGLCVELPLEATYLVSTEAIPGPRRRLLEP